jgi:hypothetical protein
MGHKEWPRFVYATFCHIGVAAAAYKENSFAPRTHLARSFNGGAMLADLLIGISLWTATSVLAAISLGRILQRGKISRARRDGRPDEDALSDVA